MSAIAFDTLAYAKKLKAVGVPEAQAEIQAETIAEVMDERMATKRDLDLLESNLKRDVVEIKHDMREIESNLKHDMAEIKHDMKELETNLKRDMKEFETNLKHDMAEIKHDMKEMELKFNANLQIEIAKCKTDLIRWQIGLSFGTIGILFTLMKLSFGG